MLEPRSRTVDPDVLMESLFRLTDLEARVPLNLNVLDATRTPRVMGLQGGARRPGSIIQLDVLVAPRRSTGSARSPTGWSCSTAISSPSSTSTG